MNRPRQAIISRRKTLEVALRIIDDEGLEALSIRRLGEELNVRGISLYHHFRSKEQILVGACELALADVRTPSTPEIDWHQWLVHNATGYYKALRRHPNLIPILMRRHPLRIGIAEHNATAGLLAVQGVSPGAIMAILDATESLALGCAAYESAVEGDKGEDDWPSTYPFLHHVARNCEIPPERAFEVKVRAVIDSIVDEYRRMHRDRQPETWSRSA
jgi:AcrR family transcriptional regulator